MNLCLNLCIFKNITGKLYVWLSLKVVGSLKNI